MQHRLSFLAGIAAGYVVGARAGRGRYEQIKRTSAKAWHSDPVQHKVAEAAEAVKAKTPAPAQSLVDKVVGAVPGSASTAGSTSTTGTTSSTVGTTPTTPAPSTTTGTEGVVDASAT